MKKVKAKLESQLFHPIKDYFENLGYEVHGEVKDCDVIALKDNDVIALELKLKFNLKLLYQCLERKKITNEVYAVIETPKGGLFSKDSKKMISLLKRLEIGLFFISFYESTIQIDKILDPVIIPIRKNKRKKDLILKEITERSGSYNVGGIRGSHISAYKEASIHVAVILSLNGQLSAEEVKRIGGPDKTSSILIKNYYSWFIRVKRGIYTLDAKGISFLDDHSTISEFYFNKYKSTNK